MKRTSLGASLVFGIVLGCAHQAHAAAIVGAMSEPFDYAAATQFINASTLNGGQGFNASGTQSPNDATANWGINLNGGAAATRTATSPGLNATATGYLAASGNKLTLDAIGGTQNTGRLLGGQVIDSGTTYFSLQVSKSNDTIRTMNFAFFGGTSGTAGGTERLAVGQIGATAGNSGGAITLLMNNMNPAGLLTPANPIMMGIDVPHLLVGRIDWNAAGFETVSLWVDPADVTTEAVAGAAYLSNNAFELTSINAVRPFAGGGATVGGGAVPGITANFDEFRLGGTWASVTSESVPVPEPAAAVLVVLGSLALGAVRKRS